MTGWPALALGGTLFLGMLWATFYWIVGMVDLMLSPEPSPPEPNNDEKVVSIFLSMLQTAKKEVLMYDDGDTGAGSLYQTRQVIDAIERQLENQRRLKIHCVLNHCTGETLFERRLQQHDRVDIRQRRENPRRLHYKIFDRRLAYISCHQQGSNERKGQTVEGRSLFWRTPFALQDHVADFESHA